MSLASLPDPAVVLAKTDWAALEHAYGTAEDTPAQLVALLDNDQHARSQALDHLHHVVHHQSTLYDATVPAAAYVAAVLPDPRTTLPVDKSAGDFPGALRTKLLGWLDSVADAASDQTGETMRRLGFPPEDHAPYVQIRQIRPLLFSAVSDHFGSHDPHTHQAALAACIPLLDDPRLQHHRAAVAPLLRKELATSALWQYQERAIEALSTWGEDTTDLDVRRDPFEVFDALTASPSSAGWDLTPGNAADLPF